MATVVNHIHVFHLSLHFFHSCWSLSIHRVTINVLVPDKHIQWFPQVHLIYFQSLFYSSAFIAPLQPLYLHQCVHYHYPLPILFCVPIPYRAYWLSQDISSNLFLCSTSSLQYISFTTISTFVAMLVSIVYINHHINALVPRAYP